MAIPSWLPIAISISGVIATLIAPVTGPLVAARMNQPKPTPEINKPKKTNPENRGISQPCRNITLDISAFWPFAQHLRSLLRHPTCQPHNRETVFAISLNVASGFL